MTSRWRACHARRRRCASDRSEKRDKIDQTSAIIHDAPHKHPTESTISLLDHLAIGRLLWRLVALDASTGKRPASIIDALEHEDRSVWRSKDAARCARNLGGGWLLVHGRGAYAEIHLASIPAVLPSALGRGWPRRGGWLGIWPKPAEAVSEAPSNVAKTPVLTRLPKRREVSQWCETGDAAAFPAPIGRMAQ